MNISLARPLKIETMEICVHQFLSSRFVKTRHFVERQKERGISDRLVSTCLHHLQAGRKDQLLIVVSAKVLRDWAKQKIISHTYKKACKELFIKVDGHKLITCFTGEFGIYRGHRKAQQYWFIQSK